MFEALGGRTITAATSAATFDVQSASLLCASPAGMLGHVGVSVSLNGQQGTIAGWDAKHQRWRVHVAGRRLPLVLHEHINGASGGAEPELASHSSVDAQISMNPSETVSGKGAHEPASPLFSRDQLEFALATLEEFGGKSRVPDQLTDEEGWAIFITDLFLSAGWRQLGPRLLDVVARRREQPPRRP